MKFITFSFGMLFFINGFSFVKIDSVKSIPSRCNNTGSLIIYASSSSQIFYKLEFNSTTTPTQTSNQFLNLAPSIYKVKVININNDIDSLSILVSGSYLMPDIAPISFPSSCSNNSDGMIIGRPISGNGLKPFIWSLKNMNTGVVISQGNDTFKNLRKGDYNLTMTDSCGNVVTRNVNVAGTTTGIGINSFTVAAIGCHSFRLTTHYSKTGSGISRVKYEYQTHTYVKLKNQTSSLLFDTLPHKLRAGIIKATVYNHCGDSSIRTINLGNPFISSSVEVIGCDSSKVTFNLTSGLGSPISSALISTKYELQSVSNINSNTFNRILSDITHGDTIHYTIITTCSDTFMGRLTIPLFRNYYKITQEIQDINCVSRYNYRVSLVSSNKTKGQVNLKLQNQSTRNILLDSSIHSSGDLLLTNFTSNQNYVLVITNGCGLKDSLVFYWAIPPVTVRSVELKKDYNNTCLDSTVGLTIIPRGYYSDAKLKNFNGSISKIINSKKKYQFNSNLNYSQLENIGANVNIQNFGAGKYYFRVYDTCGYIDTNVEFFKEDLSNNFYSKQSIVSCFDDNKIVLKLYSQHSFTSVTKSVSGSYSIFDIERNSFLRSSSPINFIYNTSGNIPLIDTFKNLLSGKYIIRINYTKNQSQNITPVYLTSNPNCNQLVDTIVIPVYRSPSVRVASNVVCKNTKNLIVIADSAFGRAPYRYEVNSGPQLFPIQSSNKFVINQVGSYQARIWDTCGNASTYNFTIDTLKFEPIMVSDTSCNPESVTIGYVNSPFVQYHWEKPNGNMYQGHRVVLEPVNIADLGLYKITKFVDIEGCKDTFNSTYTLVKSKRTYTIDTIYKGDTILFNSRPLTTTGIYRDTFSAMPCDSISILNLFVHDSQVVINHYEHLCYADTFNFRGKKYFSSGTYFDTVENSQKIDSIFMIVLNVNDSYPTSTRYDTIKDGDSSFFRGYYYYGSGSYHDTAIASPCDSIYKLHLHVRDTVITLTEKRRICAGDSFLFYGTYYKSTGIYNFLVPVVRKPDTLYQLRLEVNPIVRINNIVSQHCNYFQIDSLKLTEDTTIYDTIASSIGCDSIINVSNYQIYKTKIISDSNLSSCDFVKFRSKYYYNSVKMADSIRMPYKAYSSCDSIKQYINVEIKPKPILTINPSRPNLLNVGETVKLNALGALNYVWNESESFEDNLTYIAYKNKTFTLIGTSKDGCNDTVQYRVMLKDSFYYTVSIPSAFTPNGDGNNDVLFIKLFGVKRLISFKIFNRFGQLIFMTDDEKQGWDGYYKGTPQNSETYFFTYEIETFDNKKVGGNGNLMLLR